MIEYYPHIKTLHVTTVLISGALFAARGVGVQRVAGWPMAVPVRYLSYLIDTVLLTSALALYAILPAALFANHWLTVKVVCLVLYIVLGTFALKRARTQRLKMYSLCAALLMFATMLVIARTHDPLGPLRMILP